MSMYDILIIHDISTKHHLRYGAGNARTDDFSPIIFLCAKPILRERPLGRSPLDQF